MITQFCCPGVELIAIIEFIHMNFEAKFFYLPLLWHEKGIRESYVCDDLNVCSDEVFYLFIGNSSILLRILTNDTSSRGRGIQQNVG